MTTTTQPKRSHSRHENATPTTGDDDNALHGPVRVRGSRVTQTMSSREIAELVESRHDSVKRTIERLADRAVVSFTPMVESSHEGAGARPTYVYLVGKRDSYVIVAQLSPDFTARLVDRWQELEAAAAPAIPQSFADALRLAADKAEQLEAVERQLALAVPSVEFVGNYVKADGLMGFRQVTKLLKANERQFGRFLIDNEIMYYLGGTLTARQRHINAGRFEMRTGEANKHAFNRAMFTPKGVTWIAALWAKHCGEAKPTGAG